MKLDILAFGAHPDDVELSCSGTMLVHSRNGKKTGIVDLTRGELGTRGTPEEREREAADASKILGLSARENLNMADGLFVNDPAHQMKVVSVIRKYQPEIILCNAESDRHPDHPRGASLVSTAAFLAGLQKIESDYDGKKQSPWRTKAVYHYIQDRHTRPAFVIDVSSVWEDKLKSILAYKSQFYDPNSKEPDTPISSKDFFDSITARAQEMGHAIRVRYAEGFTSGKIIGVRSLFDLY